MIKRKLKRIGFLILILALIWFIIGNTHSWSLYVMGLGEFEMPAAFMMVSILAAGVLIGFTTAVWLRKRRERPVTRELE